MSAPLLVLAPMRIEARAVEAGAPGVRVARTGVGPARARRAVTRLRQEGSRGAVALVGIAGGLATGLVAGDVVVADRILHPDGAEVASLPAAEAVAAALAGAGLAVRVGTIVSTDHLVRSDRERRALAGLGTVAVDMESAAVAGRDWAVPLVIVRAIADVAGRPLVSASTIPGIVRALRSLRCAAPVLETWAAAGGPVPPVPPTTTTLRLSQEVL